MSSVPSSTLKIGGYSEGHLLKQAMRIVGEKSDATPLFSKDAEGRIPKFDNAELDLGKVLGRGGFCTVSEIVRVQLKTGTAAAAAAAPTKKNGKGGNGTYENDERLLANVVQDRNFMETHFLRKGKDYRYAIKMLKEDAVNDVQAYVNGIVDLAIEARFLAVIRHPNIIKMRAISSGTPFSRSYFVVLDRLYDILSRTFLSWRKRDVKGVKKLVDIGGKKARAFWAERITVAHDLACALNYLHSLNVVYRDLKPDNIGFDVRGDVKIFDFGLSRQFPKKQEANGLYKMTGDTGSPRYMAPEVALEQPYNETVDVYSFSILLYQICSLETPFEGYNLKMFDKKVTRGGYRPKINPKWSPRIQKLLAGGWSADVARRPAMEEAVEVLRDEIAANTDEGSQDFLDASGKSQKSLHSMHQLNNHSGSSGRK